MEQNIIPFGKYKGKPIEILANDKEYTQWLLAQSWFKEKNVNLYTVIINNFREPLDTPEHNKMQIKFLDINYRLKFALFVNQNFFKFNSPGINNALLHELSNNEYAQEIAHALRNPDKHYGIKNMNLLSYSEPSFEIVDVAFKVKYGTELRYSYISVSLKQVDFQLIII